MTNRVKSVRVLSGAEAMAEYGTDLLDLIREMETMRLDEAKDFVVDSVEVLETDDGNSIVIIAEYHDI